MSFSTEPKAQVSFPDHSLSVVRRRHCSSRCRKLFIFLSSSPEPMSQFHPNLAQSNLAWRGFKFVIRGDHNKTAKLHERNIHFICNLKNLLLKRHWANLKTILGTKHSSVKRIQVCWNEGPFLIPIGDFNLGAKIH